MRLTSILVMVNIGLLALMISMISSAPTTNCDIIRVRPRHLINKFTSGDWIVVDRSVGSGGLGTRSQRFTRSVGDKAIQNGRCSWKFILDDNASRIPRFIPKAQLTCTNCSQFCKASYWDHHVLTKGCKYLRSQRQKVDLWRTATVTLPISFTYNP